MYRIQHIPDDSPKNEKIVLYEEINAESETKIRELEEGDLKEDENHKRSSNNSDYYNHEFQWIYPDPETTDDLVLNTVPHLTKYSNVSRFVS